MPHDERLKPVWQLISSMHCYVLNGEVVARLRFVHPNLTSWKKREFTSLEYAKAAVERWWNRQLDSDRAVP